MHILFAQSVIQSSTNMHFVKKLYEPINTTQVHNTRLLCLYMHAYRRRFVDIRWRYWSRCSTGL